MSDDPSRGKEPKDVLAKCRENLERVTQQSVAMPLPGRHSEKSSGRQRSIQRLTEILGNFAGLRDSVQVVHRLENLFANTSDQKLSSFCLAVGTPGALGDLMVLVEELTNHETYFYRHPEQLKSLYDEILMPLLRKRIADNDRRLTIWSAACSTGEEPFTLAMMVFDALKRLQEVRESSRGEFTFTHDWKIRIVGSDISEKALALARAGVYVTKPVASFREMPPLAWRFFTKEKETADAFGETIEHFRISESVKKLVRYEQFNLATERSLISGCDIVLCRNVLIYMRDAEKRKMQEMLKSSLAVGGVILLGGADVMRTGRGCVAKWIGNNQFYFREGSVL
ncbi:MAG: hypothetical protein HOK97_02075 [Deltaproteobacteria bacterium]|nr:hypothetical protein [Deltaproteobacteria bacterium]